MKKTLLTIMFGLSQFSYAGCFDGVTTSATVYSKIRGFYINKKTNNSDQEQFVILDKNTCSASQSGDITLASTTKSHYYLSFKGDDNILFSLLLAAKAQDTELEFRIGPSFPGSHVNSISYAISPQNARLQP